MQAPFERLSESPLHPLRPADSEEVNQVLAALVEGDFSERWNSLKRLTDLGEKVVPQLLRLLEDSPDSMLDWEGQWFTIRALGNFDRPDVVAALVNQLVKVEA